MPFLQEAWRAVTKIRSQLPAAVREEVAGADGQVRARAARVSPREGCGGHFEVFREAIAAKRKVRCRYDGGGADGRRPFLFRPYALFLCQRAWYVVGHGEPRDAERSPRLNRLAAAEATGRPYLVPEGWALEKSLGKAWRMMRGGRRYAVSVRFDAEAGRNVADTPWHPTRRVAWGPDGSLCFARAVDGLDEIVWWVLGHGRTPASRPPPSCASGWRGWAGGSFAAVLPLGDGRALLAVAESAERGLAAALLAARVHALLYALARPRMKRHERLNRSAPPRPCRRPRQDDEFKARSCVAMIDPGPNPPRTREARTGLSRVLERAHRRRVLEGVAGLLKPAPQRGRAVTAMIDRKKRFCRDCDDATTSFGRTRRRGLCSCVIAAKARVRGEECPAGKW